jgi:hypothetical protein
MVQTRASVLLLACFLMLSSLLMLSPLPARADVPVRWTNFTDPRDGAFTVEVPADWNVIGGISRRTDADFAWYVTAVSPDGEITLRFGDPQLGIISATSPRPTGKEAAPKVRVLNAARPYETGVDFATNYGKAMTKQLRLCDRPKVVASSVEPNPPGYGATLGRRVTTGDALLLCIERAYVSYSIATTVLAAAPAESWDVPFLGALVAPVGRRAEATRLLRHMAESWNFAPAWIARMRAGAGPLGTQLAGFGAAAPTAERARWSAELDAKNAPSHKRIDGIMEDAMTICDADGKLPARHECGESGHPPGK